MPEIIDRRISFNGGELSPWLDPRLDLDKYRMGCRTLENMLPSVYGGALRRSGTEYLGNAPTASGQVRLVPFVASVSTSYILEFSALKLRVWTTGATPALVGAPLVVVTPFAEADLNGLQFAQQNDVLFISHPNHFPRELARYSATDWRIGPVQVFWPATMEENITETTIDVTSLLTTAGSAWLAGTSYAVGNTCTNDGKVWSAKEACVGVEPGSGALAERHWVETITPPIQYSSAGTYAVGDKVFSSFAQWQAILANSSAAPKPPETQPLYWSQIADSVGQRVTLLASAALFAATDVGSKWVIKHKRDDLKVEVLGSAAVGSLSPVIFALGEWSAAVTAASDGGTTYEVVLQVQRSLDNINWETRNVITSNYGAVQKLITGFEKDPCFLRIKLLSKTGTLPTAWKGSIEVGDPNDYAIYQIIGYSHSKAVIALVIFGEWGKYSETQYWQKSAWNSTNGYPRAVTLHQGRLYFGGTALKPTTIWGSAVDGYTDFRLAAEGDAAVSYTLNSDEASTVEWLVSQDQLVIGTASGEWVFGARVGENEEKLRRNTSYGSLPVQARALADALVFIQRSGRKLREFAWSFDRDGYAANDLSMLAEHMGDSLFLQMAIQRNPDPVVWLVTADGSLLALTYERGQKVAAWSRHVTDGLIESVAVVPGSGEDDQVWLAVSRTINGTTSRYIERNNSDTIRDLKSGATTTLVYSDCSKTSTSSASSLVTGLTHLIGKTVSLLVDGKVHAPVVVNGSGQVQLTNVAANQSKTVVAGLPYASVLEPTYLETMDAASLSLAGKKRLHRAVLEFWKSGAVTVSTDGGVTFKPVVFETGTTLMTGPLEMYLDGSSGRQVTAIFKQTDPLPFNLMGLMLRYNIEMG